MRPYRFHPEARAEFHQSARYYELQEAGLGRRFPVTGRNGGHHVTESGVCYGTPHATGPNRTDQDRAGLALHFLNADPATADLLTEPRDCRPWLTGPKASGGLIEYGELIDWDREVDARLAPAAKVERASRPFAAA